MSTSLQIVEADKARFNAEASAWDANQKHVESVQKAFEAVKKYVPAFADGSSKGKPVSASAILKVISGLD